MNKREPATWVVERHNVRDPECDCKHEVAGNAPSMVIIDGVIQENDSQVEK